MVLRFYRWLPLELEPDYKDGYTCDHCHKEFLDAPFYHEESTGTDYCVSCGAAAGYTPYTGLVGSLLFSSGEAVLRDSESNAVISFAYKMDAQTVGVFFVNNVNIVLHLQMNGSIRDALIYTVEEGQINTKSRLTAAEVNRRLPWLSTGSSLIFDIEIKLHSLPSVPVPLDDVSLISYSVNEEYICIRHLDDYAQTFEVDHGREIVSKATMPICVFIADTVDDCSKNAAGAFLRESADALK
ncbi:hypothetical protein ABB37_08209 [Leptomonas pyrrhocoris]|uniref:Uncharacterized protein n=1 Tax=Leptomonas pyrrhocoris TaxID=157538 RepID=A0A0N0VDS0_LEPPY|nr:hypothetical protein ABB37_08209 [Leptomonas pyrrhocoris]XP_015654522.1 hypothetical protein ABB37_08209 [Leptomonas pyrrhocoris]KPA76082.1 hypothetical protein ABB37_08209 [Leptomonas pyrrhocoris]KPA76083.1 hypothetical protein ABB37_08209 [Leptomonas pyrrhocoris]|eukprot:XP_015654521.1 hypothetical protein ABB37_08209 [Leptomonas pyrrhocoris]